MEQMMLIITITRRGEGSKVIDTFNKNSIPWHFRLIGQGTATSEVMDILGMGTRDKDVIVSIAAKRAAAKFMDDLGSDPTRRGGHGIMMVIPLEAINSIVAAIVERRTSITNETTGDNEMKNEYKHSLVFAIVNRGFADEVMEVAKKCGATGGTVVRANLADNDAAKLLGKELEEEREIVAILLPDTIRDNVMESVNSELGLKSEAQAIVCAVGVDKAMRI